MKVLDPYYLTDEWRALREQVLNRDRRTCQYCGGKGTQADHIKPRRRGGPDSLDNLACCCPTCNKMFRNKEFPSFESKKAWMRQVIERSKPRSVEPRYRRKANANLAAGLPITGKPNSPYNSMTLDEFCALQEERQRNRKARRAERIAKR